MAPGGWTVSTSWGNEPVPGPDAVNDDPRAGAGTPGGQPEVPDLDATLPNRVPFTPAIALAAVAARAARRGAPRPADDGREDVEATTAGPGGPLLVMPARVPRAPVAPDPAVARRRAEHLVDALVEPGAIRAVFQPVVRLADGAVVAYEALARTDVGRRAPRRVARRRAGSSAAGSRSSSRASRRSSRPGRPGRRAGRGQRQPGRGARPAPAGRAGRTCPGTCWRSPSTTRCSDYEALREVLARLRTSGSLVAVDDVGAGYASMAHVLALGAVVRQDRPLAGGRHAPRPGPPGAGPGAPGVHRRRSAA